MAALNPKGARQANRKVRRLKRRLKRYKATAKRAKRYDPLAPVTGLREMQEMKAAQRLEFGGRTQELRSAIANQDQTTVDRAGYYDDWRQALRESTARVNAFNAENVAQQQARVDTANTQDSASLAQRNAAATEQAAKFGRAPVQSNEGAQAVAAQRSQGNQSVGRLREAAGSDNKYLELKDVNVAQAKTEDQSRMASRREKLRQESKALAAEKGAFRTDFRRKTRQDEREYAAIQKEFGLKKRGQDLEFKNTKADRAVEKQKIAAQKIVASLYASADIAGARAQVRVAKLQLEKGRISKSQYRHIINTYRGLPGGGKGKDAKAGGGGSGAGGSLAPWERDKVSNAVGILNDQKAKATDRATWMKRMRQEGVPYRLARIAWKRYVKRQKAGGQRPSTAGNPNVAGG